MKKVVGLMLMLLTLVPSAWAGEAFVPVKAYTVGEGEGTPKSACSSGMCCSQCDLDGEVLVWTNAVVVETCEDVGPESGEIGALADERERRMQ